MTAVPPLLASVLAFLPVAALLSITPGADTLLVLRTAGLAGARAAVFAALGVGLGCMGWGLLVALGLGAVLVASPLAFAWLKAAGALYLAWIGMALLRGGKTPQGPAVEPARRTGALIAFRRGFLTNLLNPKVGVFYLTLLPQFLPQGPGMAMAGLVLAAAHVLVSLLWFAVMIVFAARLAPMLARPAVSRGLDRLCGVVFIGFGAKLALSRA